MLHVVDEGSKVGGDRTVAAHAGAGWCCTSTRTRTKGGSLAHAGAGPGELEERPGSAGGRCTRGSGDRPANDDKDGRYPSFYAGRHARISVS